MVHFKGQLLGKDEAPNRKIAGLTAHLGIQSDATFLEGDVSAWSADLLAHRQLGDWVVSKVRPFYDDVIGLLCSRS